MSPILKNTFILFLLLLVEKVQAQKQDISTLNNREKFPSGLSLYAIGPNAVCSISYDRFLTYHLQAEAGIGFIGAHAGLKAHLLGGSARKWTPYVGVSIARSLFQTIGMEYLPYFPIGVQFAGDNRFNFAFEVAPLQLEFYAWNLVGIKFGYRW
ncbi:hypothetical protein [Marivirga harenae]|uniref:hypothetical protein n=1 Tax=Marivirga harenae TaxID=2010992 RepID=UPI0026DF8B77|nr:hypothetical protein [Marivirga harenae]WKV12265.1 hypothetical protein Q3Y49_00235 [Marivirga harenae]|tara:strand:- start:42779 stop:43240 length:462 start_codon:yes stop_codon:yes gene_type:complete